MSDTFKQFKKELKELLEKHNVSISADCADCSDLHGVYQEHISIYNGKEEETLCEGWDLEADDIEINKKIMLDK